MADRSRRIVVAVGKPNQGKTTLVRHFVERYERQHGPDSIRILDPALQFPQSEWPGKRAVDEWIRELTADGEGPRAGGWGPGLLVLDDMDRYVRPTSVGVWDDVWLANRHLGLDVMITGHRPSRLPKDVFGSASELWLFAQSEPNALKYLAEIPELSALFMESRTPLPTSPGVALRVNVDEQTIQTVKLF